MRNGRTVMLRAVAVATVLVSVVPSSSSGAIAEVYCGTQDANEARVYQ